MTKDVGADSVVLLTELGIVNIDGLDNRKKGFVARNGFNEGSGEHLCLGTVLCNSLYNQCTEYIRI